MASSSFVESITLYSSTRLDPQLKKKPLDPPLQRVDTSDQPCRDPTLSQFWRFLYFGEETDFYKAEDKMSVPESCKGHLIKQLIQDGRGKSIISLLYELSNKENTQFQSVIAYSLAVCCCSNQPEVKRQACEFISQICTNPLMMLEFAHYYQRTMKEDKKSSGLAKDVKKAIAGWYKNKRPYDVAFAVSSCPSFQKLSHKRLIRLTHIKPDDDLGCEILCTFISRGFSKVEELYKDRIDKSDQSGVNELFELLAAVTKVKQSDGVEELGLLIAKHHLQWGHLPYALHGNKMIWRNALPNLPLIVLMKQLTFFHKIGLFEDDRSCPNIIVNKLKNQTRVVDSALHPFRFFWYKQTYAKGKAKSGTFQWEPDPHIIEAFDDAFGFAMQNVRPTEKRICITVDASKSMKGNILNSSAMDCQTVAAVMCYIFLKTEPHCIVQGFSKELTRITFSKTDTIKTLKKKISQVELGGTDCSRPMITAKRKQSKFDSFVIFTDSGTWKGKTQPKDSLQQYRTICNPRAKLVVASLKSRVSKVADPSDRGMLDICGFTQSTPDILHAFLSDQF